MKRWSMGLALFFVVTLMMAQTPLPSIFAGGSGGGGNIPAGSCTGGTAGCIELGQGTAPSGLGTNSIQIIGPTGVTSYQQVLASTAGSSGCDLVTVVSTTVTHSFGPCSVPIASGTAAMGTGAITSATCATVVTVSATGVATTDTITASFNGDPTAVTGYIPSTSGMLTIIPYPTANNVNFKVCNNTSGSVTPGAITLNWRVAR